MSLFQICSRPDLRPTYPLGRPTLEGLTPSLAPTIPGSYPHAVSSPADFRGCAPCVVTHMAEKFTNAGPLLETYMHLSFFFFLRP